MNRENHGAVTNAPKRKRDLALIACEVEDAEGVEVALDDLSSELTRVAEGQQFVTKVLTDRSAVPAVLPPGAPLR